MPDFIAIGLLLVVAGGIISGPICYRLGQMKQLGIKPRTPWRKS